MWIINFSSWYTKQLTYGSKKVSYLHLDQTLARCCILCLSVMWKKEASRTLYNYGVWFGLDLQTKKNKSHWKKWLFCLAAAVCTMWVDIPSCKHILQQGWSYSQSPFSSRHKSGVLVVRRLSGSPAVFFSPLLRLTTVTISIQPSSLF